MRRHVIHPYLAGILTFLLSTALHAADLVISEFMALNDTTLTDDDGDYVDWIEIHNPSTAPINLAGWYLTDKASDLQKWRFPAINLASGEHLIVFASNKDRRNARAPLHTNFALSGDGEYLALVRPDGITVEHDYAPGYPPQSTDISYGIPNGAGTTALIAQGALAQTFTPATEASYLSDVAGFESPAFSPLLNEHPVTIEWTSATTWSNSDSGSDEHKLAHGYLDDGHTSDGNGLVVALDNIPFATYRIYGLLASDRDSIYMHDFNVNGEWVHGGITPMAVVSTASVTENLLRYGMAWTEIIAHEVEGNYWTHETSGPSCTIIGQIAQNGIRGSLTGIILESTDPALYGILCVDFADSTSDAFSGGQEIGPLTIDSANWHSTLNRDSGTLAAGSMTVALQTSGWRTAQTGIGYDTAGGYGSWIGSGGNIETETYNINASAFVRIPFRIPAAGLQQLVLRMRYDDGFRAYLNGVAVAEDAAPATPTWNATATSNRDESANEEWTAFDLSAHIPLLEIGSDNLLAFQLFNVTANSSDLLLLPELDAVYDLPSDFAYFDPPTPGTENGAGTLEIGPSVKNTTDWVPRPNGETGPDLVITTQVTRTLHDIGPVQLHYRWMFDAETSIAMTPIGDNLYTASIPVAGRNPGQMVRWRVAASDIAGHTTTQPAYIDPLHNDRYYGTVTQDDSFADSRLPVVEWFVENYAAARTDGGTRCALYYLDRFYDNVFIGLRGGTTSSFAKNSYKLDFNRDNDFLYRAGADKIKDLRWMQNWGDKTKIHNSMSHETAARIGAAHHFTFPVRVQCNGTFDRITEFMENDDNRWLERLGRDPEGALLKMITETAGEKKTRRPYAPYYEVTPEEAAADDAAKNALFSELEAAKPIDTRRQYVYDHLNLPDCINYLVAANLFSHQDHGHKNYYLYRDTNHTGEWSLFLWDLDLSWGRNWYDNGGYLTDALTADNPLDFNTSIQNKTYNRIYRAIHEAPELREMYFRRLRTCMDEILQSPETPSAERLLEARFDAWLETLDPVDEALTDADLDRAKWGYWGTDYSIREEHARTKSLYLDARRQILFNKNPVELNILGESIPTTQPSDPAIRFEALDVLPASGNALEEYFTLINTNNFAVDISGWRIEGAVEHTFRPGTVIPSGKDLSNNIGRLYVARDTAAFRARTIAPTADQFCFVQGGYAGQLSARGETLLLFDPAGRLADELTYAGTPTAAQNQLRVSEIMYAPTRPTASELALDPYLLDTDFEFIELVNTGSTALDLGGATFAQGIEFTFPTHFILPAGGYTVVAASTNAFALRYGTSVTVAGQFDGFLDNSGETIVLLDPVGEKVLDFTYESTWHPATDGFGFSLVVDDLTADWTSWDTPDPWRASATVDGSPGSADPEPVAFASVRINEVLAHTDLPQTDSIELFNPTDAPASIGGWFLTDDFTVPQKFRIPEGTEIPGGGFIVFNEGDFNTDPALPTSFQLSSTGDDVWLFSADLAGNLTGYVHGFAFGASPNGVSFGRLVTTTHTEHFPIQSATSLGGPNAGPLIGPVVLSEIMPNPALLDGLNNPRDEYIELANITATSVNLFDSAAPTNTWRVSNAVDYSFPPDTHLDAHERILLVSFDPSDTATLTAFRAAVGADPTVRIFGPWSGALNNAGERIELQRPDNPNIDAVPYWLAEALDYTLAEPWPAAADATGASLQRIDLAAYGNDPDNWFAAAPRPGQAADLERDRDGDGLTDWAEWKARTDPLDPASCLRLRGLEFIDGTLHLTLDTVVGRRYALDTTTNLLSSPFLPLIEGIEAESDLTTVIDPNAPAASRYYRLRLDP